MQDRLSALEKRRTAELEAVSSWFQPGVKLLELGARNGFQAAILSRRRCDVVALDVALPADKSAPQHYPVQLYDGRHIPAADSTFDVLYSSHMLCYALEAPELFAEMRRVLKPGGLGIHIMPTVTWRTLTLFTHYPFCLFRAGQRLTGKLLGRPGAKSSASSSAAGDDRHRGLFRAACRLIVCPPVGSAPSAFHEWHQWWRFRMVRLFAERGFETLAVIPLQLLYSGHSLLGKRLSLSARRKLARIAGSSSCAYITRKSDVSV